MREVGIEALKSAIKHIAIRLDEPIYIEGTFGVGKTDGAAQVISDLNSRKALVELLGADTPYNGAMLCDIRLGQYDSVDLRGLPQVNRETGFSSWRAPETLPFVGNDMFPDDKLILVAFDEMTSAERAVFGVAYQLINERCVGEHRLKNNVRIIAMGNLSTDKGIVNRIPMPLHNRFTHYRTVVSVADWSKYAQNVGVPPIFTAFINWRKPLLHNYDSANYQPCVATPRTWMKAVKYYTDTVMNLDERMAAMEGAVGTGPATEFWGFHDVWNKVVPIKNIIADPMGVDLPEEESMQYATAVNVSGNMNLKTITPLYKFMTRMSAEYVVLAMHLAVGRDMKLFNTPEFLDFGKRYRAVFQSV